MADFTRGVRMSVSISIVRGKGQITLPREVREAAHLEVGDPVEIEVTDEGSIVLRPKKLIDTSQAWFWTAEWQAGEREASEDIEAGRMDVFMSGEDFLESLEE
jgi:AbrB family looped-hinge helix DNA binding protein